MTQIPRLWIFMLHTLFDAPQKYAMEVWRHYPCSPTVLYQLSQAHMAAGEGERFVQQAFRLLELVEPADLLAASVRACPEGKRRPRVALEFEEQVLSYLNCRGQWAFLHE